MVPVQPLDAIGRSKGPEDGSESNTNSLGRNFAVVLLCTATALLVAMTFDDALASWIRHAVPQHRWMPIFEVLKFPGHFGFTIGVAVLIGWRHASRWMAAAYICVSGAFSGVVCAVVKWVAGRTRPLHGVAPFSFKPFRGGLPGLFRESNLSFPSGHTCLAFATATAVSILLPRMRVLAFAVATLVAIERVLQDSHYCSDVIGAAGLGAVTALIVLGMAHRVGLRIKQPSPVPVRIRPAVMERSESIGR